jgi:hypothetical protein
VWTTAPTWGIHVLPESRPRPQDSQHVLSQPFEVLPYELRADQCRKIVSMSYRIHLGFMYSLIRQSESERVSVDIAPTWGIHVLPESRPRPRDSQHILSQPFEVLTYKLRADQGRKIVSMSYCIHLGFTYSLIKQSESERVSVDIAPTWGIHVLPESRPRPRDSQHILSHPFEVFTY